MEIRHYSTGGVINLHQTQQKREVYWTVNLGFVEEIDVYAPTKTVGATIGRPPTPTSPINQNLNIKKGALFRKTPFDKDIFYFFASNAFFAASLALVLPSGWISPALWSAIFVRSGPTSS